MSAFVMVSLAVRPGCLGEAEAIIGPLIAGALQRPGARRIELLKSADDPGSWKLWQEWSTHDAYRQYLAWRGKEGGAAPLLALLAREPETKFLTSD